MPSNSKHKKATRDTFAAKAFKLSCACLLLLIMVGVNCNLTDILFEINEEETIELSEKENSESDSEEDQKEEERIHNLIAWQLEVNLVHFLSPLNNHEHQQHYSSIVIELPDPPPDCV